MRLIIGRQNPYTYTWTPGTGKLVINGILNFGLHLTPPEAIGSIVSIYDVTASVSLNLDSSVVSIVKTTSTTTGAQIFTLTWSTLPGGLANGDTLLITVNCGYEWAVFALLEYQKA
jgi:hypothetical protein